MIVAARAASQSRRATLGGEDRHRARSVHRRHLAGRADWVSGSCRWHVAVVSDDLCGNGRRRREVTVWRRIGDGVGLALELFSHLRRVLIIARSQRRLWASINYIFTWRVFLNPLTAISFDRTPARQGHERGNSFIGAVIIEVSCAFHRKIKSNGVKTCS